MTNPLKDFQAAVQSMFENDAKLKSGEIKPYPGGNVREEFLCKALSALGKFHGVNLQSPMRIDSNGEISLVALHPDGRDPQIEGCGKYGEPFARMLSNYSTRTGMFAMKMTSAENGWSRINHFEAEKLVKNQYDSFLKIEQAQKALESILPDGSAKKLGL